VTALSHSAARALAGESRYAWFRLGVALALGTVGSVGMWSVVVALPAVQADFGVNRADASMPFTLAMIGFAFGAVANGRLADRFGISARSWRTFRTGSACAAASRSPSPPRATISPARCGRRS
jgi:MFS family permease